jgi:hypothetical protein
MKWLPASVVLRRATVKKCSVARKAALAARPVPPLEIDAPPVRPVRSGRKSGTRGAMCHYQSPATVTDGNSGSEPRLRCSNALTMKSHRVQAGHPQGVNDFRQPVPAQ